VKGNASEVKYMAIVKRSKEQVTLEGDLLRYTSSVGRAKDAENVCDSWRIKK
jgi:hypothetical protein